jgi:hypothetical protein
MVAAIAAIAAIEVSGLGRSGRSTLPLRDSPLRVLARSKIGLV